MCWSCNIAGCNGHPTRAVVFARKCGHIVNTACICAKHGRVADNESTCQQCGAINFVHNFETPEELDIFFRLMNV